MPASIASLALLGDVGGEDRGQREQADHDAGVAGGDRPAAVDRLRRAPGERGLGQRREHQREADPDQDLRRQGQRDLRLRQAARGRRGRRRRGSRPPRRARLALGTSGPRRLPRSAASGITETTIAAPIGVRRQPSISSRTSRKSAAAIAAETSARARLASRCGRPVRRSSVCDDPGRRLVPGDGEDRHRRGERDRHLDQEDRLPGDELGEHAADRRPERRPGRAGRRPRPSPRGARSRPSPAAARAPRSPRRRRRAPARSGRAIRVVSSSARPQARPAPAKTASPTAAPRPGPTRRASMRRGHRGQRHHQVEGDQHPGDAGDAGVELAVDLGQGEDDDRGVGEDEADGERQGGDARPRGVGSP